MCNHPSFLRIRDRLGSNHKTVRGVLQAYRRVTTLRRIPWNQPADIYAAREWRRKWKQHVEDRKADPEVKRALADKRYRRYLLTKMRRRENKLCRIPTAEAQWEVNGIRGKRAKITGRESPSKVWCSLIQIDPATATEAGAKICRMGKDYRVRPTWGTESRIVRCPGETRWKRGRPVRYTRAQNTTYVPSWGLILDDGTLQVRIGQRDMLIAQHVGHHWDVDRYGLRLVRDSDGADYHPSAADLLVGLSLPHIIASAALSRQSTQLADTGDLSEIYVCRRDSWLGGNCRVGTEAWVQQHKIRNGHVRADIVRRFAQDSQSWMSAKKAVAVAAKRHLLEMQRGVCDLSEHGVELK